MGYKRDDLLPEISTVKCVAYLNHFGRDFEEEGYREMQIFFPTLVEIFGTLESEILRKGPGNIPLERYDESLRNIDSESLRNGHSSGRIVKLGTDYLGGTSYEHYSVLWDKLEEWKQENNMSDDNVLIALDYEEYKSCVGEVVSAILDGIDYGPFPFNKKAGYLIKSDR